MTSLTHNAYSWYIQSLLPLRRSLARPLSPFPLSIVSHLCSFPKQPADTAQDTVFLWVVWVIFRGDLEEGGESGSVGVYFVADALCDLWWA